MSSVGEALPVESAELYDELLARVDGRTRDLAERTHGGVPKRRRGWLVRRVLVSADVFGLLVALAVAEVVASLGTSAGVLNQRGEILVFCLSLPVWVVAAKVYGLYDRDEERADHSSADDFAGVFNMVTVCAFLFWALCQVTGIAHPPGSKLLVFWVTAITVVWGGRAVGRGIARRHASYVQNTVVVGTGDVARLIAKKIRQHPEYRLDFLGFVAAGPSVDDEVAGEPVLGGIAETRAIVRLFGVERIIFAFPGSPREETLELVRSLRDLDVQVDVVPGLFELVGPGVGVHTVEGLSLVGLPPLRLSASSKLLKRTLDLMLALPGLVLLSPLFALMAVAIKLDSSGPVLFHQLRMGAGEETFRMLKFRSMAADADERKGDVAHLNKHLAPDDDPRMFKAADDPRVTRVGRFLRDWSLDELPQLWNVVRGEMSLVGPRPLILDEHQHVEGWARRRLDLKPGITGLWQTMGRDDIPFGEMTRLDYLYVTGWSIGGDLKLMLRTLPAIAARGS